MEENQSILDLQVDQETAANLNEISRWGKFLAYLALIGCTLVFLLFLFLWNRFFGTLMTLDETDTRNSEMYRIVFIIVFVIAMAIIAVLMMFLIKGASRIRAGIRTQDQILFNSGLANLRNYFAMYGILAIIGLLFALIGLAN